MLRALTETHEVTPDEAERAGKLAAEANEWLTETEAKQAALAAHEPRVLTVAAIKDAFDKVERRLRSLSKRKKKRVKKAKKEAKKADADAEAEAEKEDAGDDAEEEPAEE